MKLVETGSELLNLRVTLALQGRVIVGFNTSDPVCTSFTNRYNDTVKKYIDIMND